jgi:chemotaxis protein methyltransferase CheR
MTTDELHQREFPFTERDFQCLREMVRSYAGIVLSDAKHDMVYSRLAKRLREIKCPNFEAYCRLLSNDHGEEFTNFINAITTNLTAFFRENHHFLYLAQTALPHLVSARAGERRLRLWSAGCSTGEEPYSIAIVLNEYPFPAHWDVKLLATDLDTNVLQSSQRGIYAKERINGLSQERLRRFFERGKGGNAGFVRVKPLLKALIHFQQLNLMKEWPLKGPFDVIFCRNVVIYFDKDIQHRLFDRFADLLTDDGYLFVGHSESLYRVTERFELIGSTIYRKRN